MENQENNQPEFNSTLVEVPNYFEKTNDEKECKTCNNKTIGKGNTQLIIIGSSIVFLTCYGFISLVKDVISMFTR